MPILRIGQGKPFGELAVQKDQNKKIYKKLKPRAASVICRNKCKFAVMSKENYQSVLDIVARRKSEK